MKKPLLAAFIAFDTLLVGAIVAVVLQPDTIHVERSVLVNASPADLYPLAHDHKNFQGWSPWADRDPNQKTTYSESSVGVGAVMSWEGNDQVGKGKMTITEAVENTRVVQDLEFIEPYESKAVSTFALTPEGEATKVTWSFDSSAGFMQKAMGLFVSMDSMLGPDFEKGLSRVKEQGEARAVARKAAEEQARLAAEAAAAAAAETTEGVADEGAPGVLPGEAAAP